jgi:hypothetical protein
MKHTRSKTLHKSKYPRKLMSRKLQKSHKHHKKSIYGYLRNPKTLKVGHIAKTRQGKYLKVSKKHKYVTASKGEVACDRYFKRKIKRNIIEMKSKKRSFIKSPMQAVAIAYSQTRKKYPRCKKVKNN